MVYVLEKQNVLLQDEVIKVYCDWKKECILNLCAAICIAFRRWMRIQYFLYRMRRLEPQNLKIWLLPNFIKTNCQLF
jgi:hypothetical protein